MTYTRRCSRQPSQEASGQVSGALFLAFLQYLHNRAGTPGNYPVNFGCEDDISSQKLLSLKFSDNSSHVDVYKVYPHLSPCLPQRS